MRRAAAGRRRARRSPARWGVAAALGVAVLGGSADARACDWFVDGDASPGADGTEAAPFASVSEALAVPLSPGDVVCVMEADEPYPDVVIQGVSGQSDAPLVLTAAPGHAPIFGASVELRDVSHWVVRGLTIDGRGDGGWPGLRVDGTAGDVVGVELRDNFILNRAGTGIRVAATEPAAVRDLVVADNRVLDVVGKGLEIIEARGASIRDNVIETVRCDIGLYDQQVGIVIARQSTEIEVAYNVVRDLPVCPSEQTQITEDNERFDLRTVGIRARLAAGGGEIHHNLIEGVRSTVGRAFVGAISLHEGASQWWVHHNISRDSGGCGLCDGADFTSEPYGATQNNLWEHNTAIDHTVGIRIGRSLSDDALVSSEGAHFRSNLLVVRDDGVRWTDSDVMFTTEGNLYWTTAGGPPIFASPNGEGALEDLASECGCDEGSSVADPMFDPRDGLTPLPGGAAVDAAAPDADEAHGAAPDIGALEPPVLLGADVDANEPAVVRLRVENRVAPPLLPAGGCEGLEVEVDGRLATIASCQAVPGGTSAETTVRLDLVEPLGRGSSAVLRHSGALTDSIGIGGRIGARLPAFERVLETDALPERRSASDTGCGCRGSSGRGGALGLLLLVLSGARRRRTRSA